MSSFYGGKQGRTYHIVQRYDCVYLNESLYNIVQDTSNLKVGDYYKDNGTVYRVLETDPLKTKAIKGMVNQFQKGGAYTDANYGQYVLIDTVLTTGKSDPQNGLLYRRGFDYLQTIKESMPLKSDSAFNENNIFHQQLYQAAWINWVEHPGAGAIYVGQIVGPEGKATSVEVQTWNDFLTQLASTSGGFGTTSTISMDSPGMWYENQEYKYNDQINVGFVNLIDINGDITSAYIAFDIPHSVFNITAQSVDAYGQDILTQQNIEGTSSSTYQITASTYYDNNNNIKWKYNNLIKVQPNSTAHPFFHNYDIAVPNGIHGQNINDLTIEPVENFNPSAINGIDVFSGDKYLTYSITNFDSSAAGASTTHLGRWPYRVIEKIEHDKRQRDYKNWINETFFFEGDLIKLKPYSYKQTTDTKIDFNKNYYILNNNQYIIAEDIDFTSENIYYEEENTYVAICIKEGLSNSESNPFISYKQEDQIQDGTAKWLVTIFPTTAAANIVRVDYTAGPNDILNYRQVDYIFVDALGKMYVVYSDNPNTACFLTLVNSIASIETQDGKVTITYKNGDKYYFGLRQVQNIFISPNITENQDIVVTYKEYNNSEDNINIISDTIGTLNNILDIQRQGDSIIVLYSDPRVRASIPQNNQFRKIWIDHRNETEENPASTYYRQNGDPNNQKRGLIWYNFGPLGSQYHVQGAYTFEDIAISDTQVGSIAFGLGGQGSENRQGWLISIPDVKQPGSTVKIQRVFAYDYVSATSPGSTVGCYNDGNLVEFLTGSTYSSNWYEITSLADAVTPPSSHIAITTSENVNNILQKLQRGGIWFKVTGGKCDHD